MVDVIGIELESPCMDKFNDAQLKTMGDMVSTMNKNLFLSSVDYKTGRIGVGVHHHGNQMDWDDKDYLSINVGGESVGCMFYEVASCIVNHL